MNAPLPIRTLLVDDEGPARSRLRQLLKHEAGFQIVGEAANGREAIEEVLRSQPELVFLDVQMPGLDGLQVCAELGEARLPTVVFVTAYDRFALQAFELHAVDYLLKPIDRERFQKTLQRLRQRLRETVPRSGPSHELQALLTELKRGRRASDRLAVKTDGRVVFLRFADIEWIEAEGNYVKLHAGTATHLFRETLTALEAELPPDTFLRVSRSAIVNLDAVKELQPLFYGDYAVCLRNGTELTLSRNYRGRVDRLLHRSG